MAARYRATPAARRYDNSAISTSGPSPQRMRGIGQAIGCTFRSRRTHYLHLQSGGSPTLCGVLVDRTAWPLHPVVPHCIALALQPHRWPVRSLYPHNTLAGARIEKPGRARRACRQFTGCISNMELRASPCHRARRRRRGLIATKMRVSPWCWAFLVFCVLLATWGRPRYGEGRGASWSLPQARVQLP